MIASLAARSWARRLVGMRGNRNGYGGTSKSFGSGGIGEDLGGDLAWPSGVCNELGGLQDVIVVNVAFDLQFLNMLLNVGGVALEKVMLPYVSIQSQVFQL